MVNQKIQFMMDYVTAVVVGCVMKDTGLSVSEAMKAFYNSQVFDRLCDSGTGFYSQVWFNTQWLIRWVLNQTV